MRATIFVLTGWSVNNCYHATISIPPSDLTTALPLLGAFNELFTSRLNIDKFCVNLRKIKTRMLKTTRCTSPSLSGEGLTKFAYKKLTSRTPWRTLCKLLMNISWKIRWKKFDFPWLTDVRGTISSIDFTTLVRISQLSTPSFGNSNIRYLVISRIISITHLELDDNTFLLQG